MEIKHFYMCEKRGIVNSSDLNGEFTILFFFFIRQYGKISSNYWL